MSIRKLGIIGVALYLAVSLPSQLRKATHALGEGRRFATETRRAALERTLGPAYVDAILKIASAIPERDTYAIVDEAQDSNKVNWIRYDLAPRRPVYLGEVTNGIPPPIGKGLAGRLPRLTVIASGLAPPRLAETRPWLDGLPASSGIADHGIPGWLDVPAEGERMKGAFVARGWCQELGGRPCAAVKVWLDGEELPPSDIERYERGDVAAVVPGIGSAKRAGFRITVRLDPARAGAHRIGALLLTADGRYRPVGPWRFWWEP